VVSSVRTIFTTLFCFLLCASYASAQSPVGTATGKTINVGLGYSYVSHGDGLSHPVGLNGANASFTIGYSRLALKADVGYARAANVHGTGRHSDVLSYLVGPVYHPKPNRHFDPYLQVLVGAARVTGPAPLKGGGFLLGGWMTYYAWAMGGGVDYWISSSLAIRTGADYMRTAYFDPALAIRGRNNLRTTATIVYYFGRPNRK
jgi:hypothetical protein